MDQWSFMGEAVAWMGVALVLLICLGVIAVVAMVITRMLINGWRAGSGAKQHDHHDH